MTDPLDPLRRHAKALKKAHAAGDPEAQTRAAAVLGPRAGLTHAEALHVVARENGAESWPKLKLAREIAAESRAARAERLKLALYLGQHHVVQALLAAEPDLGSENFGLQCALYDIDGVRAALARDPACAERMVGVRRPILHLAFSRHIHGGGDRRAMLAVAEALVAAGADVNDSYPYQPDMPDMLPALYGAVGHGDNMELARWLLEHGADPNDNESLYHATELPHLEGLRLLLAHGARPEGTNALPRALDFGNIEAARLLLEAGADPNEGAAPHPSGQPTLVIPALHQAARRLCGAEIAELLLAHGADPALTARGHTPYAYARVYSNRAVAGVLERAGGATPLSPVEAQLARAADGETDAGERIDMDALDAELALVLCRLVWREGTLPHMRRLVAAGFDPNRADEMGMPPLHLAGWEGMAEKTAYFLTLQPDLAHLNAYGGTLFSTILHGSENCPQRAARDHVGCMRLALELGVDLPRRALGAAGDPEMAGFLADWAAAHPGQVTAEGVV